MLWKNGTIASDVKQTPFISHLVVERRGATQCTYAIWNALPVSVRSSSTLPSFRAALKRYYFQDAFLSQSSRYNW
jgi:hypothetical protein